MGWCMNLYDRKFGIKAGKKQAAFNALMELARKKDDYYGVASSVVLECHNLRDAVEVWGWDLEEDSSDDIIDIHFNGEKLGEDLTLFETLAPFVTKGSFIEMTGDEASHWRWVFNGKTCVKKQAKVSW